MVRILVDGLPEKVFPIDVGFVGAPLTVHATRVLTQGYAYCHEATTIAADCGETPQNSAFGRQVFATNSTPFPMRVTWDVRFAACEDAYRRFVLRMDSARGEALYQGPQVVAAVVEEDSGPMMRFDGQAADSGADSDEDEYGKRQRRRKLLGIDFDAATCRVDIGAGPDGKVNVSIDPPSLPVLNPRVCHVSPATVVVPPGATQAFDVTGFITEEWASGLAILRGVQTVEYTGNLRDSVAIRLPSATTTTTTTSSTRATAAPAETSSTTTTTVTTNHHEIREMEEMIADQEDSEDSMLGYGSRASRRRATDQSTNFGLSLVADRAGAVRLALKGSYHPYAHRPDVDPAPLKVYLTTEAKAAALAVDDPTGFAYTWHANLPHDHPTSTSRLATLTNTSLTSWTFVVDTMAPFLLGAPEASLGGKVTEDASTFPFPVRPGRRVVTLPPRESVDVPVLFREPEEKELTNVDYEMTGELHVSFSNGDHQSLGLKALVVHPALEPSTPSLAFGKVHTRTPKPMQLVLSNPTVADAEWCVVAGPEGRPSWVAAGRSARPASPAKKRGAADPEAELSETEVATRRALREGRVGRFRVEPHKGVIPGRGLRMPKTTTVTVWCEPEEVGEVEALLTFAVRRGRSCNVAVAGVGSLDERDEYHRQLGNL